MCDDCFDGLGAVPNVVVVEFVNIGGFNGFAENFIHNNSINGLLLPKLLALQIVVCHDVCVVDENGVGESIRDNWRRWEAINGAGGNSSVGVVFCIVEHECQVSMPSITLCYFDGSFNFGNLLLYIIEIGYLWAGQ